MKIWTLIVLLIGSLNFAHCEVRNLGLFDELEKYWMKIAKFSPEIEQINRYLEANVANPNDRGSNMKALESMAAESVKNPSLHQVIMTLLSLRSVLGSAADSCNTRSFVILAEGFLLIGGEPMGYTNLNRAEKLVLGYAYEHKKLCLPQYVTKFEREISRVRATPGGQLGADIDRLRELFSHKFVNRLSNGAGKNSATILEIQLTKFRVYDSAMLKDLVEKIEKTTIKFGNKTGPMKRRAIEYLEYFREPCERYCSALNNIFKPTKFDVMTFSGRPSVLCDDSGSEFCNHWKLFRTCEAYVKAKKSKLIAKIQNIIARNDF